MTWVRNGTPDTLTVAGDSLVITDVNDKEFHQFFVHAIDDGGTGISERLRFNNNSNTVYSRRFSNNGGAETTATSASEVFLNAGTLKDSFVFGSTVNISGEEKLCIIKNVSQNTAGTTTPPDRRDTVCKFVPSPDASISEYNIDNTGTGDYDVGSNLSVLGAGVEINNGIGVNVGGWVEVGRTTLVETGDKITVSNLPDKRYYMFILRTHPTNGNTDDIKLSFNEDFNSNYAYRRSSNGATDDTFTSTNNFRIDAGNGAYDRHNIGYVANYASNEKLVISHDVVGQTAGETTAPIRIETVGKWNNTTDKISSFTFTNQGTGDFRAGSEAIILGWDESDRHSDNFWQELASVELSGAADEISSGIFTAKKYLWVQAYVKGNNTTAPNIRCQVGNGSVDTGSNYAERTSSNAGADVTGTSQDHFPVATGGENGNFVNMFIINNVSNEKLAIAHGISVTTTGAASAPSRREIVGKWANTSNQIDILKLYRTTGDQYQSGSILKVWGHD